MCVSVRVFPCVGVYMCVCLSAVADRVCVMMREERISTLNRVTKITPNKHKYMLLLLKSV